MISLTFAQFYKGDFTDAGFTVYFVHDAEGRPLYIGISTISIWYRWFGSGTGHMALDFDGRIHGASHIGQVIENNFPLSWEWKIDLLTEADCARILAEELDGEDPPKFDIRFLEEGMIKKFSPLYNVIHSGSYNEDPTASKRLDDDYRNIFG